MNRLKLFILSAVFAALVSACCDRSHCYPIMTNAAYLSGFSAEEAGYATVSRFTAGSNFSEFVDSFSSIPYHDIDSIYLVQISDGSSMAPDSAFDIEIYLPIPKLTYRISEITYTSEQCYKCNAKKRYQNLIASYKVNGVLKKPDVYPPTIDIER
jgi:uncharacterized sporulation protein YeaH/YhbH (DUF444 family)